MHPSKNKRTRAARRGTAYHEAGHTVMALGLSVEVTSVDVVADPANERAGVCLWQRTPSSLDLCPRRQVEGNVMIFLAGGLAQTMGTGEENPIGGLRDRQTAEGLAEAVTGSEEEAEAFVAWLAVRTRSYLEREQVWAVVAAIAGALLEQERLSGREVLAISRRVVRRCAGRLEAE